MFYKKSSQILLLGYKNVIKSFGNEIAMLICKKFIVIESQPTKVVLGHLMFVKKVFYEAHLPTIYFSL